MYYNPLADSTLSSSHERHSSRSNSVSSSSVVTVTRSLSLKDQGHDPIIPSHKKSTVASSRRRSSVAHVALDSIGGIREGIGNLNRWSQSTSSSRSSGGRGSFSRRLSIGATSPQTTSHGSSALPASPSKKTATDRERASGSSPQRRKRAPSPGLHPSPQLTALPPISGLSALSSPSYNASSPFDTATALSAPRAGSPVDGTSSRSDYFSFNPQSAPGNQGSREGLARNTSARSPSAVTRSEIRQHKTSTSHIEQQDRRRGSQEKALRNRADSIPESNHRGEGINSGTPPRNRERREKDKKTMLSRALQKANTAVLLDNAQNFEGAMEAYDDACKLLHQVMIRSSGEEDKRKLEAIRVTYTNRIQELRQLDPAFQSAAGKSLPARPMSSESLGTETQSLLLNAEDENDDDPPIVETATITRIVNDKSIQADVEFTAQSSRLARLPNPRESILTTAIREVEGTIPDSGNSAFLLQPPRREGPADYASERTTSLESPMDRSYMPPPLSPRRPISPSPLVARDNFNDHDSQHAASTRLQTSEKHISTESISWLDTIDESGGSSCSSSVHSVSSRDGLRRKHLHTGSGGTEAEFDAALDAAVEAAYDEGFEPFEEDEQAFERVEFISRTIGDAMLLKEKAQEMDREAVISAAKSRYMDTMAKESGLVRLGEGSSFDYPADEADDEEAMLEEMTKEYMLDGFDFDLQTKSALPPQSDSSEFSGSTWSSSLFAHRNTGGTSLFTVAEVAQPPQASEAAGWMASPAQPPAGAVPSIPDSSVYSNMTQHSPLEALQRPSSSSGGPAMSVRSRRLSGLNPKQLKIETSITPSNTNHPAITEKVATAPLDTSATAPLKPADTLPDTTFNVPPPAPATALNLLGPSPQSLAISPSETAMMTVSPATPALTHVASNENVFAPSSPGNSRVAGKSSAAAALRKNKSSLSLKNRTMSMSSPDGSDGSIGTPLSTTFSTFSSRKQSNPQIAPTPTVPIFAVDGLPTGGMHLFESDIHSPYSPGSPNPLAINAPIPLEPCPDAHLLRPFWLMRCFYQTIAHPRGGYLSTKLFVPRDVWCVKGVKLKAIDEKIASCDLLTAALLKLAGVDTLDADAVLEEMQALELVLDQVQGTLTKKLGSEVGVNGISTLFKEAHMVPGATSAESAADAAPRSAVSQSKSYLSSWRKLRSKNSALGLNNLAVSKDVPKESLTMSSLPMTSLPNIRFAKRDISQVEFSGPNANYMGALARLFDAVQILDQIARQVEDPGLKHSSPTHVGLELSARHAAEFFGFYICRFVLTDITLMLDKFIKRGSEWVLV